MRKLYAFIIGVIMLISIPFSSIGQKQNQRLSFYGNIQPGGNITAVISKALAQTDTIYLDKGIYELDPIVIPTRKKLYLHFSGTTLKAAKNSRCITLLKFNEIEQLTLAGDFTLHGNYQQATQSENFMEIISPAAGKGQLVMGRVAMEQVGRSGILVISADAQKPGYQTVHVERYSDLNGIGWTALNGTDIIYGLHFRGGHKRIQVDDIRLRNDEVAWTKVDTFPNFKNFSVTAEVNAAQYPRPDSLIVGRLYASCAATGLYTQAVNHVYLKEIVFDSSLRRPGVPDDKAYEKLTYKVYSFYKSSWGNNKVSGSSFRVGKYVIKNTNSFLAKQENFMIGFWLNTGTYKAKIDTLETDMPISFTPDGQYEGQLFGEHTIKYLYLNIPNKPGTMINLGDGLEIDKLVLGPNMNVPIDITNVSIHELRQVGTQQNYFQIQQPNYSLDKKQYRIQGALIENCRANNIKWQFYLRANEKDLGSPEKMTNAYQCTMRNFTGDHYMQIFLIKDGTLQDGNQAGLMDARWTNQFLSYVSLNLENCSFIHNSTYPGEMTYKLFDPAKKSDPIPWKPNLKVKDPNFTGMRFVNVDFRNQAQDQQRIKFNRQ
jgi:hypothetical protein